MTHSIEQIEHARDKVVPSHLLHRIWDTTCYVDTQDGLPLTATLDRSDVLVIDDGSAHDIFADFGHLLPLDLICALAWRDELYSSVRELAQVV